MEAEEQPSNEPAPSKATRRSAPKSRSGCVTCKRRRVKCDEQKPECNKCLDSGRICEGYAPPARKTTQPTLHIPSIRTPTATVGPSRQLFNWHGTPEEHRAFEFFFCRTAPQLSGYFDADFWGRLVLQLGQYEPAIRHGIMAVSSAHEHSILEAAAGGLVQADASRTRFILSQYNKAIKHLSEQPRLDHQPSHTLLLTCVLFICLEFLCGDVHMAMTHTLSGLRILSTWQADIAEKAEAYFSEHGKTGGDFIDDHFTPIFCRLAIFSTLLGKPTPLVQKKAIVENKSPSHSHFTSLSDARAELVDIMNDASRFLWDNMEKKYAKQITITEILGQVRLEIRLSMWHRSFEKLESASARPTSELRDSDGLKMLKIHYYITLIWVATCLSTEETDFDTFLPEFQKINDLAADLLTRRDHSIIFSFEMEIIGPVYFVAIKCRHPATRRRSITMLREARRREGAIDSKRASRIATAVLQIEETSPQLHDNLTSTSCPSTTTFISRSATGPSPSSSATPDQTAGPRSNTDDTPLPPEDIRIAHVIGLPTSHNPHLLPSSEKMPNIEDTDLHHPPEGNRVHAQHDAWTAMHGSTPSDVVGRVGGKDLAIRPGENSSAMDVPREVG